LRGYFSLLNFEDFEEYLGLILFFLESQASFADEYQEINNKDYWSIY
jgi:hypothetical protein